MVKLFILILLLLSISGCTDSPNTLGTKALRELSRSELEISSRVMAVDNVSVDVDNCSLINTDLNFKRYEANGIIHNVGRSSEDAPSGGIARGDRISIDFHVNCRFKVGSTGAFEITGFNKEVSVNKL